MRMINIYLIHRWHFLDRYRKTLGSKDVLSERFLGMLSDAIFINDQDDVQRVKDQYIQNGCPEEDLRFLSEREIAKTGPK
jgi:hypothetical protein